MKKLIMLAFVLTTLATSAFSDPIVNVNRQVLTIFNKTYTNAQGVNWEPLGNYLKASFTVDGQHMFAYYRKDGEQFATSRNILSTQLPISLAADLKAKFDRQWITDLFEISSDGETTYFATLNSADQTVVLQAEAGSGWTVFQKTKRAAE